jgi:hypothetical protein
MALSISRISERVNCSHGRFERSDPTSPRRRTMTQLNRKISAQRTHMIWMTA